LISLGESPRLGRTAQDGGDDPSVASCRFDASTEPT
jgi:hypothetical protein